MLTATEALSSGRSPQAPGASSFPSGPTVAAGVPVLTVAAVVGKIRQVVEGSFPTSIWVEGEISNCSYPASGHIYFTMKDEKVTDRFGQPLVLPAAFFKGANQSLKFKLVDGLKVLCLGQITVYEGQGKYQIKVLRVEPKGQGALQLAFEQLKARLQAEGLFDPARKRPIPTLPDRVGIITSKSGSAIHDMVSKLQGHFHVIILPVKVQGEGAALEIAGALDYAGKNRLADVLIAGRGGGSVEDLWAFNEEPVARAIARCPIPVISAVGHQDDWSISDYVADFRASTPTDAAKMLVRNREQLVQQTEQLIENLRQGMLDYLDDQEISVSSLTDRLRLLHPSFQLEEFRRRGEQAQMQLLQLMQHGLDREDRKLQVLAGKLQALSPLAVLARGYSITFSLPGHGIVRDAASVEPGQELETRLEKGKIISTVLRTEMQVEMPQEKRENG